MKTMKTKRIMAVLLALVVLGMVPQFRAKAEQVEPTGAGSMTDPFVIGLGNEAKGTLEKSDIKWYKVHIPEDVIDQSVSFRASKNPNTYSGDLSYTLIDGDQKKIDGHTLWNNDTSGSINCYITSNLNAPAGQIKLEKGKDYYFVVNTGSNNSFGEYEIAVGGSYTKMSSLSFPKPPKKGAKSFIAVTTPGASVVVVHQPKNGLRKTYSPVIADQDGNAVCRLNKKLKAGDKVFVTSTKDGYEKKKKTFKIK